jgi:hypothetical protein
VEFISDQADYGIVLAQVNALVDLTRYLPEQVFRARAPRYIFADYDRLWDAEAWAPIADLAKYYGDSEILMIGNPPDAELWREDGYPHTGAARMSVSESGDAYRSLVWQNDVRPFDEAVLVLTMTVASAGFAMWAERSGNVAIFALYDLPGRPAEQAPPGLHPLTIEEAIGMLDLQFSATAMPVGFADQMRREYGNSEPQS